MKYFGQKLQDKWIVEEVFPGKRNGYFLDLAAAWGELNNNTVILERELDWGGLAIEPNPEAFDSLRRIRKCQVCNACIDGDFGVVEFLPNRGLGGIVAEDVDNSPSTRPQLIAEWREAGKTIMLPTAPLAAVLAAYKAPAVIDYFSFDVEGAETRILRNFPFSRYRFMAATIERPTPELNQMLFARGYVFIRNHMFDSFYVHESLPNLNHLKREPFEQVEPKSS